MLGGIKVFSEEVNGQDAIDNLKDSEGFSIRPIYGTDIKWKTGTVYGTVLNLSFYQTTSLRKDCLQIIKFYDDTQCVIRLYWGNTRQWFETIIS